MEKLNLINFLNGLPEEDKRDFELSLTQFAKKFNNPENKDLIDHLLKILEEDHSDKIRYYAFYCLNIIYRYKRDFYKLNDLYEKYEKEFEWHPTFKHLKVLFQIESESMYDFDEVLNDTFRDSMFLSKNAGFVHLFPVVFAKIYESGGLSNPEAFLNKWLDRALKAADLAIKLDSNYAVYYQTKGRVLAINNDFDEAIQYINKAISLEDSERSDYPLRISEYQYHKLRIQVDKKLKQLQKAIDNAESILNFDLDESLKGGKMQVKNIIMEEDIKETDYSKPYIFVSYAHDDVEEVLPILKNLQKNDINIWFDRGLIPGQEYPEVIGEKLMNAAGVLFIISPNAINREFVRMELALATKHAKKRLGIFLEDTVLTPGMDLQLGIFQFCNKFELSPEEFYKQLLTGLNGILNV